MGTYPGGYPAFKRLWALGRRLFRLPGLSQLRTPARKALAVSEPARWVSLLHQPASIADESCRTISVLSANLWHDWPRHRRLLERLEAFACMVKQEGVDILLLQEVASTTRLHSYKWLAERLGMACAYARANGHHAIGFEEGLAVFSRFSLGQPRLRQLGRTPNSFTRRLALGATVHTSCGDLLAISTHLALSHASNADQFSNLRDWVSSLAGAGPAVVGGDFNAHETSPQVRQTQETWLDAFRHLQPDSVGATHELRLPWGRVLRRRLDYIFLHPGSPSWQVLEARHVHPIEGRHSDHLAVLVRLALA